jgi:hypothetical protein
MIYKKLFEQEKRSSDQTLTWNIKYVTIFYTGEKKQTFTNK